MSLTFGFYNSINGDRVYDAIQMGQIFDGIITDGIYATYLKAMVVKASDNASEVIVQPGRAWFNHTWTYIDADYPVEAPAPEVILDRVDTLVLDINAEYSDRENKILWVTGTPASVNPEVPSLINTTTHHQYPLCNVYRKAGTTMIYAADITNRVGTSDTPFVTGVLTGINIDDLLSQWDDEFHTWEASTKTSFEAWMVNQQSVYVTWFESIRTQMEGDLSSFEAWFETIRGIIDEEAATHLQAEIDELKDMLPAGSHIDISTNETTLFNRNVTVSDGVHSKTVQFNAVGGATVESFPYIGIISVTSTDGTRTAEETINIPYFGRYSVVLAFWSATVNLVGDESLAALPVTVRDSNGDVITVVTLNASGQGVFTATKPDTYKFIYTYGGQTMETTLQVTQETTYEVEIHGGFNYQAWLTAGRVSKTFSSLDDILEDEPTLRQLFLVHDAVDYLASQNVNTDVEKIFNTDLAAKWINLSDYALDTFYAVADIKSIMDTADKYGYGEWVITDDTTTPPTWGPKGNVPVMTANNAPYGEAITNGTTADAYKAFDNDDSTAAWSANYTYTNTYFGYKFINPICPKRVKVHPYYAANHLYVKNYKVEGSNDGSNWDTLTTGTFDDADVGWRTVDVETNNYYLYLRFFVVDSYLNGLALYGLQFYGRELKVSVPNMTSNTAPYGVASASNEGQPAYYAFDNNDSTYWSAHVQGDSSLQYKFPAQKNIFIWAYKGTSLYTPTKIVFQGSNDGITFENIDIVEPSASDANIHTRVLNSPVQYEYFKVVCTARYDSSYGYYSQFTQVQFYGLDYSEKEFEVGTTKKWLYDHGVELEELIVRKGSNAANGFERASDELILSIGGSGAVREQYYATAWFSEDLSNYSLYRATAGDEAYNLSAISVNPNLNNFPENGGSYTNNDGTVIAEKTTTPPISNPNTIALDVSSITGNVYVGAILCYRPQAKITFKELWLE